MKSGPVSLKKMFQSSENHISKKSSTCPNSPQWAVMKHMILSNSDIYCKFINFGSLEMEHENDKWSRYLCDFSLPICDECIHLFLPKCTLTYGGGGRATTFLAATKQLYEWFSPSVRLSVRHTFLTMFPSSYHHEIFRSYYQWQKWRPCKRSRSEVKGQGHRGHNPT